MSDTSGEDITLGAWWVDYLENEMDPGLDGDLQFLLTHCEADRVSFEHFRLLREWLRSSDPIATWPIEERLTRVRCKVMREIERGEKRSPSRRAPEAAAGV